MLKFNFIQQLAYSPWYVQLVVCKRCNLSCSYCNEHDKVSNPIPVKMLKSRIDLISNLGAFSIAFTGGEPLLHPDIDKLVVYAKRKVFKVGVITNGYLLTEQLIQRFNKAHLDVMQLSLDGVEPNKITIKALRPMKGRLEMLSQKALFQVNINSVIGATDSHQALEVIKFANKLGFYSTIGLIHDGEGRVKLTSTQLRVYQEANNIRKKPLWDLSNFENDFINNRKSDFKCRAGSRYIYVDELGIVRYCSQQKTLYSKSLEEMDSDDLNKNFYTRKACSKMCTIGCVRRSSWVDQWRRQ